MEKNDEMMIRRKAVQSFLVQLTLRRCLSEVDTGDAVYDMTQEEIVAARAECTRRINPFDQKIAPGHVRMLSGTERPTYVLVARRWTGKSWLVIPFSDFVEPATESEIKLHIDGGVGLRVLQLWNARSLLEQTLAKSWLVHTLPATELEDAVSAWKWTVGEGELSEEQLVRTGLPIMRRDDPRIAYEDSELANFAKLDVEDLRATERLAWLESVRVALRGSRVSSRRSSRPWPKDKSMRMRLTPFAQSRVFEQDYALAAAEVVQPVAADCRIPEFDGVVKVRYTPHDRRLCIRVFGADGNPSQELDGWEVFGSDACLLGTISNAGFVCEFESAFDGVLCLAHEEGNVVHLLGSDKGV